MKVNLRWATAKALLFAALASPLGVLAYDLYREFFMPGAAFGPDPGEEIVRYLGEWAIRLLMATLAVSPASRLFKRPHWVRFRRMFGLFAFTYVVLHFLGYWALLAGFDFGAFIGDFAKRPYITVGILALACLNEVVWRNLSTDGWVNFKVFTIMPLTILFSLSQLPTMMRHRLEDEDEGDRAA